MITYQDFLQAKEKNELNTFIRSLISQHMASKIVKIAFQADAYDRQENLTIGSFIQKLYSTDGRTVEDFTASNLKIASNFFNTLNNQRTNYSLGNGVTFADDKNNTKEKLGNDFDTVLKKTARYALIHGVSFLFLNVEPDGRYKCYCFKLTEFVPLYDETTGILRAGVRFYQIDQQKPFTAVLYDEDGYTVYRSDNTNPILREIEPKRGYKKIIQYVPAEPEENVIGEENYGALPIVPLWGSELKQSTLVGMRQAIDSYDLIRSGFANDIRDCAQVYWIIGGAMGMQPKDLAKFRDRILFNHIAVVDEENSNVTPYTQEVPFEARTAYLEQIKQQIYEDFGGLNVADFSSGTKTATEIQAAYQPLDDRADDFEYQIIQCVQQILKLIGIDDTPVFKRNRISNQLEQVQLIIMEAEYLDDETILNKLPNITPDEVKDILKRRDKQDAERYLQYNTADETAEDESDDNKKNDENNEDDRSRTRRRNR